MAITGQTAVSRPPRYAVHKYDAASDTPEALNEWAVGLFAPMYGESNPAFQLDGDGVLHSNVGGYFTNVVPDGFWIIFNLTGAISVQADVQFQMNYELTE